MNSHFRAARVYQRTISALAGGCVLSFALTAGAASLITVPNNGDGTFGTNIAGTDTYEITVYEGDSVKWTNLTPTDSVVQIGAAPSVGMNLCEDPALSRPYNVVAPYAATEFTGPLRNSPAGMIALSPNNCGYYTVPSAQACTSGPAVMTYGGKNLCAHADSVCEPALGGDISLKYKVMDETWANPDVAGVFLRLDWKDLHTGPGQFNFSFLDREIHQAAKYGKVAVIGVRVGSNSVPDWVFDEAITGVGLAADPVDLKDGNGGSSSSPGSKCGTEYTLGSPSDVNYRNHFTDLLSEMGSYLAEDARKFQHVAGVKVTGFGLETLENRATKRCNAKDPTNQQFINAVNPFVNGSNHTAGFNYLYWNPITGYPTVDVGEACECNTKIWSDAGYTPSELYRFYRHVEDTLFDAFRYRAMVYMLIQEGFPQVGENGGYEGDTLAEYNFATQTITQSSVAGVDYPLPTEQTETILREGREGRWTEPVSGAYTYTYGGRAFMASHQALDVLPQDRVIPAAACSQQAIIDVAAGTNLGSPVFPISAAASGAANCPNKWAANEGILYGQNTGFQTTNSIETPDQVDSTLWNLTANTNATYYENYERVFWRLANEVNPGTGPTRAVLDASPTIAGAVAKNLSKWGDVLRWRRYKLSTFEPQNVHMMDPFPTTWQRTFSKDLPAGQIEYYYYINPRVCSGITPSRHMRIKYIGR
ncbi:MAG: hypothetical protein IPK82_31605 [Polyangiaceae bacterium]|nr:hypothetical protein [Polyangiaceae bacterium]